MEKTGHTEKLKYDFDTSFNLEVFIPNLDNWFRVTSREFRSFTGKRRINEVEYEGPVYIYNTNNLIDGFKFERNVIANHNWVSKRRPGEDWD
jgi:hypothetical protein